MRNLLTRDVSAILILVVIMIVAGLMLSSQSGNGDRVVGLESSPNPSIYNDRASGMRAFFEWTSKLGLRTEVDRTSWTTLSDNAQMLVSIEPHTGGTKIMPLLGGGSGTADKSVLTAAEAESVKKWLAPGRTLLLMTSNLSGAGSGLASSGDPAAQFGNEFGIDVSSAIGFGYPKYLSPTVPIGLLTGVSYIRIHDGARVLRTGDDAVTLFGVPPLASGKGPKKGQPFAIEFSVGKGHVIVIADSEFACNANLIRADNAVFLSNIYSMYTHPGDRVLFDEYHHGDIAASGEGVWQAMGRPIQLAIIQACLALVVLLIVLGSRFGAPIQVATATKRTSGEYVTSLAGLYRSAKATSPALEIVYRQFLRDMCSRLALPADISLEQLADAAARRANLNKVNLRRLFSNCERAIDQQNLTESDFLELVRQMERFRKDLGID